MPVVMGDGLEERTFQYLSRLGEHPVPLRWSYRTDSLEKPGGDGEVASDVAT